MGTKQKAIVQINKAGALLVFAMKDKKEPQSLWSRFYPKSKMRWEWDDDSDNRVAKLWHTRGELSDCRDVIYSKWFQGRATFFSREVFVLLMAYLETARAESDLRTREAKEILETLQIDSPLSPKQLKDMVSLQGKLLEPVYNRAMKELWNYLLIVGFGEIEDSSFPSLAVASSQSIYEELWNEAQDITVVEADRKLSKVLGKDNAFYLYAQKLKTKRAAKY
jgi:hypothetical protein